MLIIKTLEFSKVLYQLFPLRPIFGVFLFSVLRLFDPFYLGAKNG